MTKQSERISPALPPMESFHEGTLLVTPNWRGRPLSEATWGDQKAPCHGNPEMFFEGSASSIKAARKVCRLHCKIRTACAVYAMDREERIGAWGGMSAATRRRFRALWELLMYPGTSEEAMIGEAQGAARERFNADPRAPFEARLRGALTAYRRSLADAGVLASAERWDDGQITCFSHAFAALTAEAVRGQDMRAEYQAERFLTNADLLRRANTAIVEYQKKRGETGPVWVAAQRLHHVLSVRLAAHRAFRKVVTPP